MDIMTDEEVAALALLAKNQRIMVILVPDSAPNEFVARLTAWSKLDG